MPHRQAIFPHNFMSSGHGNKFFFKLIYLFMIVTHREREREREREAETQAEGEAGPMHRESHVGFDPGSPGSRPGPKAGAKLLRHPGIPVFPS